jgi:hypothetical protein
MTPDTPDIEAEDEGAYEPQPVTLSEGEFLIFDRAEFEQDFNCYGACIRDFQVWVLDKDSRKMVPAEKPDATKPARPFRSVQ